MVEVLGYELPLPENWVVALGLWIFMSAMFWILPGAVGVKDYSLLMKLLITTIMLPASMIVMRKMEERW